MEIGEDELAPRRPNEVVGHADDSAALHTNHGQGAGAVPPEVGGFEVDSGESVHV